MCCTKTHTKPDQKCPDYEWSSFQMAGTIAIDIAQLVENWTILNPIFKKFRF